MLLMKPTNEAWIDITGEKNELQTKIFTVFEPKESIVEAARKMESEGRRSRIEHMGSMWV